MTRSYAVLTISREAYNEIKTLLWSAGYQTRCCTDGEIDMHGIAVAPDSTPPLSRFQRLMVRLDKLRGIK